MKVFVGYDSQQHEAYKVCKYSILKHCKTAEITSLDQQILRKQGLYWRDADPLASTEFTYTRFLVPQLCNYSGWALYMDSDFLWLSSVEEVFNLKDLKYAVQVVKHEHKPKTTKKMNNKLQAEYPRKNWSSLVLWNCGHAKNKLTAQQVNQWSAAMLHQFKWLPDQAIGQLPEQYNYLVGYSTTEPKAVHYTDGGPWFEEYNNTEYADNWRQYQQQLLADNKI